jgi:RHS repeat-associated protein
VGLARTKAYSGGTTTYTYDAANQLNLIWNNFGTFTNTYDGAGNVLNRAIPTMSPASFTWDGECRPTRVLGPDVSNAYIYNGNGQRVQVSTSSSSLNQVWHGENIPLEMNANIVEAAYTLEPTMYGNLISQSTPSDDLYYIFDGLGSTAFLWTGSGQNAGQYYYDAFGNVLDDSRFYATNAFQYIGRFGYYTETPDLGTYFLRARMYDPTTGRFLSRDPVGLDGGDANLYRYVHNNPMRFIDPSGNSAEPDDLKPLIVAYERWFAYLKGAPTPICDGCLPATYRSYVEQFQAAVKATWILNIGGYYLGRNTCQRWAFTLDENLPAFGLTINCVKSAGTVTYDIRSLKLPRSPQHVVYKLVMCDGATIYADNGAWGGPDHIFFGPDIPTSKGVKPGFVPEE